MSKRTCNCGTSPICLSPWTDPDTDRIFYCTEPKRHSGDHIACGTDDHRIRAWNRAGQLVNDFWEEQAEKPTT